MPQAIALAAFNAGLPLAAVNAIAGVGVAGAVTHIAAGLALTAGASYLSARLFAPQVTSSPSRGQVEFQQKIPIRFWPYGTVKLSGPLALLRGGRFTNIDIADHQLHKITLLSAREIDGLPEGFRLNDDGPHELDEDLYFKGYVQDGEYNIAAQFYLGTEDQLANPLLVANFDGWSDDHRLRGIAYALTWQGVAGDVDDVPANFMSVYGGHGQKEVSAVIRGVKVYDPRKDTTNGGSGSHRTNDPSTWEYSDNVTLCALDFLAHPDGRNKGFSRIHWESFVTAADIDDEAVALKAGGTEPRYRVATVYRFDEAKKDVMARILQARDGRLFKTSDGLIGMRGGAYEAPNVTLTANDGSALIEAEFSPGVPVMERVNQFELKAMLPLNDYGEADLAPWSKTDDPDFIAGRIFRQPLDLTQVPSNSQAQRIAKIYMARLNPRWRGEVTTNLNGLDALGEDLIELTSDELDDPDGSFDGPFFVNGPIGFDGKVCRIPVASADPDAWDWDPSEEQDPPGTGPPPPGHLVVAGTAAFKDSHLITGATILRVSATDFLRVN